MTTSFEHGYAVIIGVDENLIDDLKLPAVGLDVQELYNVLVHSERCGYKRENVQLLRGENATRAKIIEAMNWLQGKVAADPEATAVF